MKRCALLLMLLVMWPTASASADWRWAEPKLKPHKVTYVCKTLTCLHKTYVREKKRLAHKIKLHDKRRLAEWKRWIAIPIPYCTWFGESGQGPQYARARYTMPNSGGSGAYGKFQMMSGTYHSVAKYHDWSPLDQEIAARREFQRHGTSPWSNCN